MNDSTTISVLPEHIFYHFKSLCVQYGGVKTRKLYHGLVLLFVFSFYLDVSAQVQTRALFTPEKQNNTLQQRIFSVQKSHDRVQNLLTPDEQEWIQNHPVIRVGGGPDWAPIDFVTDQKYTGIAKDYLDIITQKTGLQFTIIVDKWKNNLNKIKNKQIDMLDAVYYRPQRAKYMRFTRPYFELLDYFFIRKDLNIRTLSDLDGKICAQPKGYAHIDILKKEFPGIKILYVDTFSEAIDAVAKGKADMLFDTYAAISYLLQQEGIRTIVPFQGYRGKEVNQIHMTTRMDYPELTSILDKALASISQEQKKKIRDRWLTTPPDYSLFYQIASVLLVLLIAVIYWNWKLSREIAKRKIIEAQLIQSQRQLEEQTGKALLANKAKSEFLSNMSHEIRTPMNAIIGFTELLDEQLSDKKARSYVKSIRNAGHSLLLLINDILDLSKIEAGKLQIEKKPANIHKLIQELGAIFSLEVQKKGLDLLIEIERSIPDSLYLDSVRIRQILFNLLGNAVKFTKQGHIKLQVKMHQPKQHISRLDLQIIVSDTGIGIPADQIDRIFHKFEQVQGQNTREFGGTGLGLAISSKLALMMGGNLEVSSSENKGTTFILLLKDIKVTSVAQNTEAKQRLRANEDKTIVFEPARVLIVDDVADNRELIINIFESSALILTDAKDGVEAVQYVKQQPFDLVLMDIRMPKMNGYEAARQIRKINAKIPIIALTASVMEDSFNTRNRDIFDDFLRKPVLRADLFKVLSHFLPHQKIELDSCAEQDCFVLGQTAMAQIQTINQVFQDNLIPLKEQAKHNNNMDDIKALSVRLHQTASTFKIADLDKFAAQLSEAVDMFDIAVIEQLFMIFDQIAMHIKQQANQETH